MAKDRTLTPKQAAFVHWYTAPGDSLYNATESASRAGYKGNRQTLMAVGWENLGKPLIQRAINKRVQESLSVTDLTIESVIGKLEQHRLHAIATHQVNAANKALEMQGKYLKMFADRVEHVHSLEEAEDSELLSLLRTLTGDADVDLDSIIGAFSRGQAQGSGKADTPGARKTH